MAKKRGRQSGGPNKSAAIRDYLAAHPNAMPKEVVEGLKAQGVEVASALVSNIKNSLKKKDPGGASSGRGSGGAKRGPKPKSTPSADGLTLEHLFAAKEWVAKLGGIDAAKKAIDALASFADLK